MDELRKISRKRNKDARCESLRREKSNIIKFTHRILSNKKSQELKVVTRVTSTLTKNRLGVAAGGVYYIIGLWRVMTIFI